jgi:hypothetical protein
MKPQQREMVKHVAPDKISDDLDERDRERNDRAHSEFSHGALGRNTLGDAAQHRGADSAHASAAEQKEEYARAMDEAETITWEEAQEELNEIKKKEGEM